MVSYIIAISVSTTGQIQVSSNIISINVYFVTIHEMASSRLKHVLSTLKGKWWTYNSGHMILRPIPSASFKFLKFFRWGTHLYMSLLPSIPVCLSNHLSCTIIIIIIIITGTVHHLIMIFGTYV